MTRKLRFQAAGLFWWAVAGCAPELAVNPPVEAAAASSHDRDGAPTCEATYLDSGTASIVCRVDDGLRVASVAARERRASSPAPRRPGAERGVTLTPVEGVPAEVTSGEVGALAEDDLAPDPFARPGRERRSPSGRPLAEDDLAPDPFVRSRPAARSPSGRPLAQDGLAPAPF